MQAHRRPGEIKKIIDTLTSKGGAELSRAYKQLHTIAMEKAVAASSVAGPSGSVQKRPHPGSPEKAGGPTQAKLPKSPAKMGLSYPPVTEVSIRREDWPKYMYHYTTDTNLAAFRGDPLMNASTKDAYGNELKNPKGVYVTDLAPNSMDPQKLAETLFGKNQYNVGSRAVKVSSYMEFDMSKVRNADVKLVRLQSDKLPCNIYRVETGNINGVWRVRKSLMTHDGDNILVGSGKTSDWYPKQRKT
jgi:hypothetical protein